MKEKLYVVAGFAGVLVVVVGSFVGFAYLPEIALYLESSSSLYPKTRKPDAVVLESKKRFARLAR
jgi:hypothetical protein